MCYLEAGAELQGGQLEDVSIIIFSVQSVHLITMLLDQSVSFSIFDNLIYNMLFSM